jgi:hypothetical protein
LIQLATFPSQSSKTVSRFGVTQYDSRLSQQKKTYSYQMRTVINSE